MKLRSLLLLFLAVVPAFEATAAPPAVPFVDEFDKTNDWASESATWIAKFKDGRFTCENLTPDAGHLNWAARELPLEKGMDFEILTRVKMVDGTPNGFASIIWDANGDHRRIFEISTNGNYGIYWSENGKWFYNHVNVPSKLIRKTEDNDLAIRGIGGRVFFFINETVIDVIDYPGHVGPWVGLVTPAGCTNSFDRFEVRYLAGTPEKHTGDARNYEVAAKSSLLASGPPLEDFVEKFDDNSHNWNFITDSDTWRGKIADGVLEWTNKKTDDNKQRSFAKAPINNAADYEVSTRLRWVAGRDDVFVGIAWGWPADYSSAEEIGISVQGWYCFGSYPSGGKYIDDVPWTKTTLVKKATVNDVRVRKLGRTMFIFLNGQLVADVPARSLLGDQISIGVSQATTIAFDEIRVTYLKLTEPEVAAETEKNIAFLKANHGKGDQGIVYSVGRQKDMISAQAKVDMERLENERWKLTDDDFKQLTKVRKQFEGKKLISLYGSWQHPASVSSDGARVYYNYKLVGRTQYYYEFQILKRGKQEEWLIEAVQHTDKRW